MCIRDRRYGDPFVLFFRRTCSGVFVDTGEAGGYCMQAAKQLIDSCKKCICAVEEFGPLNEANRELAEYARRIGKTGKNI